MVDHLPSNRGRLMQIRVKSQGLPVPAAQVIINATAFTGNQHKSTSERTEAHSYNLFQNYLGVACGLTKML